MSWDADLIKGGERVGAWNYTHNVGRMANAALDTAGYLRPHDPRIVSRFRRAAGVWKREPFGPMTWWKILDGMPGQEGAVLLDTIIKEIEDDPARYEAMNPENGWGDCVSFLGVLRDMRAAVPEGVSQWSVSG